MNKPVRVLQMIGSLNHGGSQAVVINLYKAIDREQIQFDFILDKENETDLVPLVESLGAKVYIFPSFRGTNIHEIKKVWNDFFDEHKEYTILHSHVRSYASIYLPIAHRHGLKIIIHSHSTSNGRGISSVIKAIMQYPLRYQADYYLACSEESGEWLFGEKVVKSSNFHVLQNAIDLDLYKFRDDVRAQVRESLGLVGKHVYIHVGRLHPAKNHDFLIDVFSKVKDRDKDSSLLIVGGGELHDEIVQKINQLGLKDEVLMLGARNDVPDLFQAADCFLFPSNWEGLPVTVVEAQAAGMPCLISSNITDEVVVSPLVIKLPIDQGIETWVEHIFKVSMKRRDVSEDIRKAGFDIKTTARWIMDLYLSMN
jgi:glycosyltransferase involved in cell wall biosynthesis